MSDNVINLGKHQSYKAFRIVPNKKPLVSLILHCRNNERIIYPYFFIHPTKIERVAGNDYRMNLLGGGVDLVLHLKNFDEATYDSFCEGFSRHTMSEIHEFAGDASKVDFPVIAKIERF